MPDKIKICRININLKSNAVSGQESFYNREDISIMCAHFRVTWFPRGNIKLCRNINLWSLQWL